MSKDTAARAFFPGYVVPAALALLVLYNLWTGAVYWPRGRYRGGGFEVWTDRWTFWGTILAKLGFAAGLYAWYVLANDDRRERLALPIATAGLVAALIGVVMAFAASTAW